MPFWHISCRRLRGGRRKRRRGRQERSAGAAHPAAAAPSYATVARSSPLPFQYLTVKRAKRPSAALERLLLPTPTLNKQSLLLMPTPPQNPMPPRGLLVLQPAESPAPQTPRPLVNSVLLKDTKRREDKLDREPTAKFKNNHFYSRIILIYL